MQGTIDLYLDGRIKELVSNFRKALSLTKDLDIKIDGAPAIVIWNNFKGLRGPGVGFKMLLKQLERGDPKDYFTNTKAIESFMKEKSIKNNKDLAYRAEAFKHALIDIAQNLKPGIMLWGDCLWVENFIKEKGSDFIKVQPNTIEYTFYKKDFPNINKDFGIYIHTLIDETLNSTAIEDANVYGAFNTSCVLSKKDIGISVKVDKLEDAKLVVKNFEDFVSNSLVLDLDFEKLKKLYKKAVKSGFESIKDINDYILDNSDLSEEEVKDFVIGLDYAELANEAIINLYQNNISSNMNEGLVLDNQFKFVPNSFTKANINHMRGLRESIEFNKTIAYSTSKDEHLFDYYFNKSLDFGRNGGANYGFATYLTIEIPNFEKGWGKTVRERLYGQNLFKFEISNDKIMFLDYDNYLKVEPKAKENTYIHEQLNRLNIKLTEDQIESLYPVDQFSSKNATRLFRYLSRLYYQGPKGNLKTPIDGFCYTGKQDGNTLVVWNPYALAPIAFSKDLGKTWEECDRNSPEYLQYLSSELDQDDTESKIFDNNPTLEKESIYRLLMAYNSNDDDNSFNIAEGIFYNVVLKDDKTISGSFKYNLSQNDNYIHYFRLRQNRFIDAILDRGWVFDSIDCDGLKIGGDSDKDWHFNSIPKNYYPKDLTIYKYLKLVNHKPEEIIDCLEQLAPKMTNLKTLTLRKCKAPNNEILEILKTLKIDLIIEKQLD